MPELSERDEFPTTELPCSGYAQSKWVAEKLVQAAHQRGIPTCIHRPGMIIGHSQTGCSNTEDTIGRLVKGLIQLRVAPQLDLPMHLTPVDYVSQAIVHLASQPTNWGQAFHLSSPHALSLAELVDHIRSLNYELQDLDYDQWLQTLLALDATQDNALKPLAPLLSNSTAAYSQYLEVLTLANVGRQLVLDGLVGTAIDCPVLDGHLLKRYFDYYSHSGFITDPELVSSLSLAQLLQLPLTRSTDDLSVNQVVAGRN